MEKFEDAIANPIIGSGVPIAAAGFTKTCVDLLPILSFISLTLGILIGVMSLYFNIKRFLKERKQS